MMSLCICIIFFEHYLLNSATAIIIEFWSSVFSIPFTIQENILSKVTIHTDLSLKACDKRVNVDANAIISVYTLVFQLKISQNINSICSLWTLTARLLVMWSFISSLKDIQDLISRIQKSVEWYSCIKLNTLTLPLLHTHAYSYTPPLTTGTYNIEQLLSDSIWAQMTECIINKK